MAKLPEINYGGRVQPLQSGKAAALQGELQSINARTQAVREGVKIAENLFESEAKLDAQRRLNNAAREYQTRADQLAQDYHNDRDKPAEQYAQDVMNMRDEVFQKAGSNASGRVAKHLNPKLDAFHTSVQGDEIESFKALTKSRELMNLQDIAQFQMEAMQEAPETWDVALDLYNQAVDDSSLTEVERRAAKAKFRDVVVTESITAMLTRGDVDAVVAIQETSAYKQLPPEVRGTLDSESYDAAIESLTEWNRTAANEAVNGNVEIDDLMPTVARRVASLDGLNGFEIDKETKRIQGDLVWRYGQGLLHDQNPEEVLRMLDSGEFNNVIDPDHNNQLRNAAEAMIKAAAEGKDLLINEKRAPLVGKLDAYAQEIEKNPILSDNGEAFRAVYETYLALQRSYVEKGQVVPAGVENKWYQIVQAHAAARETAQLMYDLPLARAILYSPTEFLDEEGWARRDRARAALQKADTMMATDAISFARDGWGWEIEQLPSPRDPAYGEALKARLATFRTIQGMGPGRVSGMFDETELNVLKGELVQMAGTGEFNQWVLQVTEAMGENAYEVFKQFKLDDEVSNLAVAGQMIAEGQGEAAKLVMSGQTAPLNIEDADKVRAEMEAMVGTAYGDQYVLHDQTLFNAHIDAMMSYYRGRMNQSDFRGDRGFDRKLMEEAVNVVSGGILEVGGRQFVAPARNVTEQHFRSWMQALDSSNLPEMYTSSGSKVRDSDLDREVENGYGFADRFTLEETGTPGEYYIRDNRGRSRMDAELTGAYGSADSRDMDGGLLTLENGRLAIVIYNPGIIPSGTVRRPDSITRQGGQR